MSIASQFHLFWSAYWLISFIVLAGKSIYLAGKNDFASDRYFVVAYAFGFAAILVCRG